MGRSGCVALFNFYVTSTYRFLPRIGHKRGIFMNFVDGEAQTNGHRGAKSRGKATR